MTLKPGDPFKCGHPKTKGNIYLEHRRASPDRAGRDTEVCRTCRLEKARIRRNELKKNPRWLEKQAENQRKSRARRANPEPVEALPRLGPWVERALCASPFSFPPEFFSSDKRFDQNRAANFCHDCPVMFECAQYAVDNKIEDGVWGGLTPYDRGYVRGRP